MSKDIKLVFSIFVREHVSNMYFETIYYLQELQESLNEFITHLIGNAEKTPHFGGKMITLFLCLKLRLQKNVCNI